MTLVSDLVLQTRRRVLSDLREEINQLSGAITATATNLAVAWPLGSIQPSAVLEIDYELIFVLSAPGTGGIQVVRGYYDSTPAPHSDQALITVNPRFPNMDVLLGLNQDIDSLSSPANGLFQMKEVTLTYNPVIVGYDMVGLSSSQVTELWEIRAQEYGPSRAWKLMEPSQYKLQRNAATSDFPSGLALELYGNAYPGRPLRVQYKAPYTTPLVNPSDDIAAVTGLHPQAHDIPVLGAALRLMEFRELKRSFTEAAGEPRRAGEEPVGSSLTAMKGIAEQRRVRVQEEAARLAAQYPRQWR